VVESALRTVAIDAETMLLSASALVVTTDQTRTSLRAAMFALPPRYAATCGGLLGGDLPIRADDVLIAPEPRIETETFWPCARTEMSSLERTVTVPACVITPLT